MVKVGVRDRDVCNWRHRIDIYQAKKWMSAESVQAEAIPPGAVSEESSVNARSGRNERRTRSFDPGFNGKVLQLQVRWIANSYAISVAIEDEALAHSTCAKSGITRIVPLLPQIDPVRWLPPATSLPNPTAA